jgi:hypothetical protein
LVNGSGMAAGYTLGLDIDGRERLVVAVKGSFRLPHRGETAVPRLLDEQQPLVEADLFTGEPGKAATLVESEYAPVKPRCDVLLNGAAHVRGGGLAERLVVGLQFGAMQKAFTVWGDRVWEASVTGAAPGPPRPFTRQPISYDNAFGGVDNFSPFPEEHRTYLANPVGRGWHRLMQKELVDGMPMPSTEETNDPVKRPNGSYRPMAFGHVGRNWPHRIKLAGTYDQAWQDNVFPFLPKDFDPAYFNSAPPEQQVDTPRGGEKVILVNLTEDGRREFTFPAMEVPVVFVRNRGERLEGAGLADTVMFEPDAGRFCVVWRASLPLHRDIFEVSQIVVGRMSRGWQRANAGRKAYFPSLATLVRAHRAQAAEAEAE